MSRLEGKPGTAFNAPTAWLATITARLAHHLSPQSIRAALPFRRPAERFLLLGVVLLIALFCHRRLRWRETRLPDGARQWERGMVTHIDWNGDMRVDEEINGAAKPGFAVVKRDTDGDGLYDLEYDLGPRRVAERIRPIREQAPRH